MEQMTQKITGQTFTNQPIYINGEFATDPQIAIARRPYLLERYDFDKLINSKGFLNNIAMTLLGASIGLCINMFAKIIGNKIDPSIKFDNWEVYAFVVTTIAMGLFFCIDHFVPNERRNIIKQIRNHFESNSNNN
ncbi:MAG: hypothetical protein AB9834_00100 [Lentimicrobium sp.]